MTYEVEVLAQRKGSKYGPYKNTCLVEGDSFKEALRRVETWISVSNPSLTIVSVSLTLID